MFRRVITHLGLVCLALALAPSGAQNLGLVPYNTRLEISGKIWNSGSWSAFCADEQDRSLNGDADTDDTILFLVDTQNFRLTSVGLAIDYPTASSDERPPVALSPTAIALQVSERDQGNVDLNKDTRVEGNVLALFLPATRQAVNLGVSGVNLIWLEKTLYFAQYERTAGKDLNGDGDLRDAILSRMELDTRKVEPLGIDCEAGIQVAGKLLALQTSELAQGNRDLNGDGDTGDIVAQVYDPATRKVVSTGLECSGGLAFTDRLIAIGVQENRQGKKDLNGDGDTLDTVMAVWDLAGQTAINLGQDCSAGFGADGEVVGFVTSEAAQGLKDITEDGDATDDAAQAWTLSGRMLLNPKRDGSGGLEVEGGKLIFGCSEVAQDDKDLNKDKDSDDTVVFWYDPVGGKLTNTGWSVTDVFVGGEGRVVWRVSEIDQGDKDLNRDRDTDDQVCMVIDGATGAVSTPNLACGLELTCGRFAVTFSVPEADQGSRDLNGDGDPDDEIVHVVRIGAGSRTP